MGTVIDPEMSGELRVTVVATGLGGIELSRTPLPTKVVDNTRTADGGLNYAVLDKPTVTRKSQAAGNNRSLDPNDKDMEYLDIPAFLRRQAD